MAKRSEVPIRHRSSSHRPSGSQSATPMKQPPSDRIDVAELSAATLCCFLWGGNAVAVKYAISDIGLPPIGGAGVRFLISLPVVGLICLRSGIAWKVERRHWWLLAAHGVLTAVQIGAFNWVT